MHASTPGQPAAQPAGEVHPRFPQLFSPIRVGPFMLKNRIVNSPHGTHLVANGTYSDRLVAYHRERAEGGAALIVSQGTNINPNYGDFGNIDDRVIPWYQKVVEAVHPLGARYFAELSHPGRQDRYSGWHVDIVYAPSQVPGQPYGKTWRIPHEMDAAMIKDIIGMFAAAARRCKLGGLDGIELHFAHGNLFDQFIDPHLNQRTDEWGGSIENRLRFGKEVIYAIREVIGREMALGARIDGGDPDLKLMTNLERMEVAALLDDLDALDYLSVSMGNYSGLPGAAYNIPDASFPPTPWRKYGASIKDAVRVPVFLVGRINHPQLAEDMISRSECDMVVMARALVADPFLPKKAFEGQVEDIRPCVGAQACWGRTHRGLGIRCIYNPRAGMEVEWDPPAKNGTEPRRVVVIGGGLAGMEAARVARTRGHQVTLLERDRVLGGQIRLAALAPQRAELANIVEWHQLQLEKLGVDVRLGVEASAELILSLQPDAVVVATGSRPAAAPITAEAGGQIVDAWEVLEGKANVGKRVLVFDETGRRPGFTVSDFLASKGHQVIFATPLIYPAMEIDPIGFHRTTQRLAEMGVTFMPLHHLARVQGTTVTLRHSYSTHVEQKLEGIDTVVCSMLPRSVDRLHRELREKVPNIHLVGDALAPRFGDEASFEGHRAGLTV